MQWCARGPIQFVFCKSDIKNVDRYVKRPRGKIVTGNSLLKQFADHMNQIIQTISTTATDVEYSLISLIIHGLDRSIYGITNVNVVSYD